QGDMRSRTFPVKVRIKNEITASGPLLMPGMYARVLMPLGASQDVTLVPKDAVVLETGSQAVFVIDGATAEGDSGVVKRLPIEFGIATGSLIEVKGDLKPGQLVVVEGNESLTPGQQVVIARLNQPPPVLPPRAEP